MNVSLRTGTLLVIRDPDETFFEVPGTAGPDGTAVRIFFPDDMASANIHSWAASDRMRPSGICTLHQPSWGWRHEETPNLKGKRVFFEKWSERVFELDGQVFHVLDEFSIQAFERLETHMNFDEIVERLRTVNEDKRFDEVTEDNIAELRVAVDAELEATEHDLANGDDDDESEGDQSLKDA